MALRHGHSTQMRGYALLALPLAAVIGACTSCSSSVPQAAPVQSPASASAPASLPVQSPAAAPSAAQLNKTTGSSAPASAATKTAGSTPAKPVPTASATRGEVNPLSSAATSGSGSASFKQLPGSAPVLSASTTALYAAVAAQNPKAARKALKAGAELEAQDSRGNTPLMRAVLNRDQKVAKTLIRTLVPCRMQKIRPRIRPS